MIILTYWLRPCVNAKTNKGILSRDAALIYPSRQNKKEKNMKEIELKLDDHRKHGDNEECDTKSVTNVEERKTKT